MLLLEVIVCLFFYSFILFIGELHVKFCELNQYHIKIITWSLELWIVMEMWDDNAEI